MREMTTCEHDECVVIHRASQKCPLCQEEERLENAKEDLNTAEEELRTEVEERSAVEKKLTEAEKRIERLEELKGLME